MNIPLINCKRIGVRVELFGYCFGELRRNWQAGLLQVDAVEAFAFALFFLDRDFGDGLVLRRWGHGQWKAEEDHYQEDWQ